MKKQKLSLSTLKIKSFITAIEEDQISMIKGGTGNTDATNVNNDGCDGITNVADCNEYAANLTLETNEHETLICCVGLNTDTFVG